LESTGRKIACWSQHVEVNILSIMKLYTYNFLQV